MPMLASTTRSLAPRIRRPTLGAARRPEPNKSPPTATPAAAAPIRSRIVDAFGRQVRVDVAERFVLHVLEAREPALQRVALTADADAGEHDAIVGAENPPADARRGAKAGTEQIAADRHTRRRRTDPISDRGCVRPPGSRRCRRAFCAPRS